MITSVPEAFSHGSVPVPHKTVRYGYGAFLVAFFLVSTFYSCEVAKEMVFSTYKQQRILVHYACGYKAPTIAKLLLQENLRASRVGIAKFLRKFRETGCIRRRPGTGRPSKISTEVKRIVEEQMRADDETTATQLHRLLQQRGYTLSLRTVLRCRSVLGWTFRGSAYCQLIRDVNKQKRLAWARQHIGDDFLNVIWTDECSVQMESHRRFCCRKRGEAPKPKPRCVYMYVHCVRYTIVQLSLV